jgi:uridine kinase
MIIGITGGSGSGKTWFSNSLAEALSPDNCLLISQDNYYLDNSHIPPEERKNINFDHPSRIDYDLLVTNLKGLKEGKSVYSPSYSFITCERSSELVEVSSKPVIILEGIFILHHPALRDLLDVKVFLEASTDVRLNRICSRDQSERGRTHEEVCERFYSVVEPMHRRYVDPLRIYADIDLEHIETDACVQEVLWFLNHDAS